MQNDLPPPGGVYNLTLRTLASPNRLRKRSTCKTLIIKVSADVENHLKKKCISLPAKLFRHFFQTFFFPAGPIFPPVSCPHFLVTGLGPAPSAPPQDFPPENKFPYWNGQISRVKSPKFSRIVAAAEGKLLRRFGWFQEGWWAIPCAKFWGAARPRGMTSARWTCAANITLYARQGTLFSS